MEELSKRIQDIKEQLDFFDDELEKYEYIIDLGKKLPLLDEEYKIEKYLVQGCTSLVWLVCEYDNGKLYFKADSEAMIVKGLVYIVTSIFEAINVSDIKNFNMDLLLSLELNEIITPNRQSGVAGMVDKIINYAKEYDGKD